MTRSLRQLACSRRFRALGMLAWLMLVVNAVAAGPVLPGVHGMHAAEGAGTPAAAVMQCHGDEPTLVAATSIDGVAAVHACSDMAGNQCSCAAMCAAALARIAAVAVGPTAFAAVYAVPSPLDAPAPVAAPPLRPPAG